MKTLFLLVLFTQPPHLKEAFDTLSQGRYQWDDQLYKAAQQVVDRNSWLYEHGYNIDLEGHWDLNGRIQRSGWRSNVYPRDARLKSSYTEMSLGGLAGPNGWYYPNIPVIQQAKTLRAYLIQSLNGYEPHKLDYRAGYNRAAIAYRNGIFTFVLGCK